MGHVFTAQPRASLGSQLKTEAATGYGALLQSMLNHRDIIFLCSGKLPRLGLFHSLSIKQNVISNDSIALGKEIMC